MISNKIKFLYNFRIFISSSSHCDSYFLNKNIVEIEMNRALNLVITQITYRNGLNNDLNSVLKNLTYYCLVRHGLN
jgi:hypothetical protein